MRHLVVPSRRRHVSSGRRLHAQRFLIALALCGAFVLSAQRAVAQTVTNPQIVEFDPSQDHSTLDANGQPLVDHYNLEVFQGDAMTPYAVVNIGKPGIDSD